jgi:tetratricopeptide (TPR) repeat protein
MTPENIVKAYAGARVTRLVNRDDTLKKIAAAVHDTSGRTYVFYIEAPGGTGKTFLAREMLRRCREGEWATSDHLAATDEVDLYHHQTHSREGFMEAVTDVLDNESNCFEAYEEQRQRLQEVKFDLRGAVRELKEQRRTLAEEFLKGCTKLGREKRIVLALDTAEKLVYETDRVQQALDLSEERFSMRPWLLSRWLPKMKNAIILIGGRPSKFGEDLQEVLQEHPEIKFEALELGNFSEEDSLDYFEAVRETAERDGNTQALLRLDAISPEGRQVIHYLTEGHPITLALMIDYYLVTGRLLPEVKLSLEEAQAKSLEELKKIREKVEKDVVRQFQEIDRPGNEAIRALSWATKGMDAELLARVAGLSLKKAKAMIEAFTDPKAGLSFTKIRPADQRVFLQDEMYALMREHVLEKLPEARADQVYEEILAYYTEKIEATRTRVHHLSRLERGEISPEGRVIIEAAPGAPRDPEALAKAVTQLHNLQVEKLHYHLRKHPLEGFEVYREFAEEALQANDTSLDMQLRDELLTFVREAFRKEQSEIGQLRIEDIELDAAIRWIRRNVYAGELEEAAQIDQYLQEKEASFLKAGGPLTTAEMDVWGAWTAAYLGKDLDEAESRLREAVHNLSKMQPESEVNRKQRDTNLARAYNALGYLLRVRGEFKAACDAYRRSLPLWRDLELEVEHSNTLNNLAWANAEIGNFRRALRYCKDGLDLRESLGSRYLVGLSFNTLGLIAIKNDQPHRGRVHCERALAIFRDLGSPRGIGLAYTALAEAHRRSADTPRVYFPAEKAEQLRLAEDFANQAVQIFQEEVPERLRLVEALIELGCAYRDWARLWPEYHDEEDPDQPELIENGIAALKEAVQQAAEAFPYRQVDALVDLAWLYFYVETPEQAEKTLRKAKDSVPKKYYIDKGMPKVDDPMAFFWVQLGKMHLLQGQMKLRRYWNKPPVRGKTRNKELLHKVAEHFTLTLAYDELFAEDFRDMQRAKDTMYEALKSVNVQELETLYKGVDETAKDYDMERRPKEVGKPARPRMRNFLEEYFGPPEEYEAIGI